MFCIFLFVLVRFIPANYCMDEKASRALQHLIQIVAKSANIYREFIWKLKDK